jgi:hypothetical protein
MKTAVCLFVLALCCCLTAAAQIFLNGGCGCGVSSSAVSCSCASGMSTQGECAWGTNRRAKDVPVFTTGWVTMLILFRSSWSSQEVNH